VGGHLACRRSIPAAFGPPASGATRCASECIQRRPPAGSADGWSKMLFRVSRFTCSLVPAGWTDGRNVKIDYRWSLGDADKARRYASEVVALAPDVILAVGSVNLTPLLQATRTVPIVFAGVVDPVGAGYVESLSRPGGNATGFVFFDYGLSSKWLELLKQIAPGVTRVAVLRDPAITSGIGQFAVMQYVAPSVGVELSPVDVRDASEIERALAALARFASGGLVVAASPVSLVHRE